MPYRAAQDNQYIGAGGELTASEELRVQEIQALADTDADEALGKTGGSVVKKEVAGGSGDVVGPATAVNSNFAAFDTTTGKLIKDSGSKASDFATAGHNHTGVYQPTGSYEVTTNKETSALDTSTSKYPCNNVVKTAVDAKQETLVSGTNIKTINGDSVLGSGDLTVTGSGISEELAIAYSLSL